MQPLRTSLAPRCALLLLLSPWLISASDVAKARRERPSWQGKLSTYSIASIARREGRRDWNEVTQGNKVVLPPDVLEYLMRRGLPYDKFQLVNPEKRGLRLFTGPLDFCAAPGECYLPSWVMKQLGIKEGEACAVATAQFPNCAFVKFQPHTSDFLDIGDHYTVLTRTMENMGGLTQGAAIRVSDGKKTYTLDVLEVRGKATDRDDSNGKGVAIGLFECPVEFAEPKDIMTKKKKQQQQREAAKEAAEAEAEAQQSTADGGAEGEGASATESSTGPTTPSPKRSSKRGSGASGSDKDVGADDGAPAKPVAKFKRRKAAEAKGEVLEDEASPFAGKAKKLGGSADDDEAAGDSEPKSELAKLRAAAKAAKAEREAEEAALAEAADAAALAERPLPLVLAETLMTLLKNIIETIVSLLRQLLMPSDVRFD